jgi:signal transduction histidine kinase
MEKSDRNLSPEDRQRLLGIAVDQSSKLLTLVGSILDAAKLEAGKFVLQKTDTDIKKEVEKSMALFDTAAATKQINFSLTAQGNLPQVSLDPIRFGEVMNNLISNALKYTPQNGKVLISLIPTASAMVVAVSDSGVGIPPEKQAQLFSKFYQVKHDAKDLNYITAGTGLGLYIVKGIVEAHGGTVNVKSTPGQGATFSFTIPMTAAIQDQPTSQPVIAASVPPPSQIFKTTIN